MLTQQYTPIFAQAATGTGQLQQGLGIALGIIMAIAFIYGVIQIMGGVRQVRNGEAEGKMGIVAGILIAGAVAIMVALYAAVGLSSSVVTPQGFYGHVVRLDQREDVWSGWRSFYRCRGHAFCGHHELHPAFYDLRLGMVALLDHRRP